MLHAVAALSRFGLDGTIHMYFRLMSLLGSAFHFSSNFRSTKHIQACKAGAHLDKPRGHTVPQNRAAACGTQAQRGLSESMLVDWAVYSREGLHFCRWPRRKQLGRHIYRQTSQLSKIPNSFGKTQRRRLRVIITLNLLHPQVNPLLNRFRFTFWGFP